MAWPSTLTTLTDPNATDKLNSPSHSDIETAQNDAIRALERSIGTGASTIGTIIGDLRNTTSPGGGHVQTAAKGGTGQTTFTKGDILAAQSASVIGKLGVGADDQVLIADSAQNLGVKWGAVPMLVVSSVANTGITTIASVWTKPAGTGSYSRTFVQLWGGGGSGANNTGAAELGGGGGGGYAEGWYMTSVLSASVLLNIGRGGISPNESQGTAGTITVFDVQSSLLTAYAGGGGDSGTTGAVGGGGGGTHFSAGEGGGGSVFGGDGGICEVGSVTGGWSWLGAGGGAADSAAVVGAGGGAIYGGGGGGAAGSSAMGAAGTSRFGGNGSAGSIITAGSVTAGGTPGGGGGAGHGVGSGGQGGGGMAIITTFL